MSSDGYVLEAGICVVKNVRQFHQMSKEKLFRNFRININVVLVESIRKKKVSPVLAVFSEQLTKGLECEFGEKAKWACDFCEWKKTMLPNLCWLQVQKNHAWLKKQKCSILVSTLALNVFVRLVHGHKIASISLQSHFLKIKMQPS